MFVLAVAVAAACATGGKVVDLVAKGQARVLRQRSDAAPSSPHAPPVMVLALDGVSRDLLYDELRSGKLPQLQALLGGDDLSHAYLDPTLLSTLPSTTMAAWVTTMTGVTPSEHGVTGNEYFVRETRKLVCPAPVSFQDSAPTLAIYTDGYLDKQVDAPTVYERLRANEPDVLIWVAMNHVFRGADLLLLAKRSVIAKAFSAFIELPSDLHKAKRDLYAALDTAAVDAVIDQLAGGAVPDVLTLYLSGTDLYAHVADEGPDVARRAYLREVVDPALGKLVARLRARGMLDRMWVLTIADHGHTAVAHDHSHALGTRDAAPAVLRGAGFRVRPFTKDVPATDPFSAVLAYGGAMAYVYLADRSQCPGPNDPCPWQAPPRYAEDVLAAADAFYRDPQFSSVLDLVLTRKPKPYAEIDLPFKVYVGNGKTVPLEAYLRDHPHPTYVAFPERLRDLAVGVHGERAGDILLLAHSGDVADKNQRFYFAAQYNSWHGSPSLDDSAIPLIVANRHHRTAEIGAWVRKVLANRPYQQKVTDLIIGLREGALGE